MNRLISVFLLMTIYAGQSFAGDWHLAYEHDSSGTAVTGSYDDLIEDFLNGASIRVLVSNQMMINPKFCKISADTTYFHCQASFHGANDKVLIPSITEVDVFTTQGERIYQIYNTNGAFVSDQSSNVAIKWFTDI